MRMMVVLVVKALLIMLAVITMMMVVMMMMMMMMTIKQSISVDLPALSGLWMVTAETVAVCPRQTVQWGVRS